jgi:hypothetical protein
LNLVCYENRYQMPSLPRAMKSIKKKGKQQEKKHQCLHPGCGKTYISHAEMEFHNDFVHKGIINFACDHVDAEGNICSYKCERRQALQHHKIRHAGVKSYKCMHVDEKGIQCTSSFFIATKLTNHMRFHTREKPFKCKSCELMFASNSNVRIHWLRMHAPEDDPDRIKLLAKSWQCKDCTQTFAQCSNLRSHMLRHHTAAGDPALIEFRVHLNSWTKNYNSKDESARIRTRVRSGLKRLMAKACVTKNVESILLLGCTYDAFLAHLNNNSRGLTFMDAEVPHVDHIKPVSKFNLLCYVELLHCCNWRNLQLLSKEANLQKKDRFNEADKLAYEPIESVMAELRKGWKAAGVCACDSCKV